MTIAINTSQMNIYELMNDEDVAGTSLAHPAMRAAFTDMVVPSNRSFYIEHLKRLTAAGIQPHFMLGSLTQLETVERLIRRGLYTGPLVLNYVAIGGGAAGLNPADMMEFVRRTPDGAVLTIETLNRHVSPMCTMAIAMGLHVRCGIDDTLLGPHGTRETSVQQVNAWCGPPANSAAKSPPAGKRARSTRSARSIRAPRRRWPCSDCRRIGARAKGVCPALRSLTSSR